MPRRAGDLAITGPRHELLGTLDEVGCEDHLAVLVLGGTLGLRLIVEQQGDTAILGDQRQGLAFLNAEIRRIAQRIRMPGIAIDEQGIDARLVHLLEENGGAGEMGRRCAQRNFSSQRAVKA